MIEQRMMAVFGAIFLVILGMVWAALRSTREAEDKSDWVNHTHAVIMETDAIISSLNAAEVALVKYVLSGDPRDQSGYREAYSVMLEHLDVAKALSRTDERRTRGLNELEGLIQKRISLARDVASARQQGLEPARAALVADAGDTTTSQARKLVSRLTQEEKDLLAERDRAAFHSAQVTRWTLYGGAALNLVLLVFIFWLMRDDLKARRVARTALEEANQQLESKVAARTSELAKSNESLEIENMERRWSQAALDRQFRHNELIINSIGDAIFVVSRRGIIIRLNPGATQLSGWTSQQLTAEPLTKVLHGRDGKTDAVQEAILAALATDHELHDLKGVLKTKSDGDCAVRVKCFPIRDQDKVVGAAVICLQEKS